MSYTVAGYSLLQKLFQLCFVLSVYDLGFDRICSFIDFPIAVYGLLDVVLDYCCYIDFAFCFSIYIFHAFFTIGKNIQLDCVTICV